MSAYNPPCQAELTFMHVLPMRLKEMTEATLKLAAAMDRHSAALERQNELLARQAVIETADMPPSRDALRGYMLEAMGHTPHDKREEVSRG